MFTLIRILPFEIIVDSLVNLLNLLLALIIDCFVLNNLLQDNGSSAVCFNSLTTSLQALVSNTSY